MKQSGQLLAWSFTSLIRKVAYLKKCDTYIEINSQMLDFLQIYMQVFFGEIPVQKEPKGLLH
jgi:hypothetical protein